MARIFQFGQLGGRAFGFGDKPLFQIKSMFFDRQGVKDALDSATYYYLSRQGGYIRKVARNSMRPVRGPSAPGTPPHRHVGFLWRLLFYAYDRSARSVVVGPDRVREPVDLRRHDGAGGAGVRRHRAPAGDAEDEGPHGRDCAHEGG